MTHVEFPIEIYYIHIPRRRIQVNTCLFFNDGTRSNKKFMSTSTRMPFGSKSPVPAIFPVDLSKNQTWFDVILQAENLVGGFNPFEKY